jgi:hypothetical protein
MPELELRRHHDVRGPSPWDGADQLAHAIKAPYSFAVERQGSSLYEEGSW